MASNLIRDEYTSYPLEGSSQADTTPRKTSNVKLPPAYAPKVQRADWDKIPVDVKNTKSK